MTATESTAIVDLRPTPSGATDTPIGEFRSVRVDALRPADDNVRRDLGDLTELAESIAGQGVLQALLVNDNGDGTYLIVAGHRRHAAAAAAGLTEVPCVVRSLGEVARLEAMIVENIQRAGLTPLEEADGFRRLAELTGLGQRALGARLGRSQAHVSKRLALLGLPEDAQTALAKGVITLEGAQALVKLKDHPDRIAETIKTATGPRGSDASVTWLVDHQLAEVAAKAKLDAAIAALPSGTRHEVVDYFSEYGKPYKQLGKYAGQVQLTEAKHRKQRCHLVVFDRRGNATPCCTKPSSHPEYRPAGGGGGLTTAEKKARAEATRLNRELKIAAAGRLVHLQRLVAAPTPDTWGDGRDTLDAWLSTLHDQADRHLLAVACELLRLEPTKGKWGGTEYVAVLSDRTGISSHAALRALTLAAGEWQVREKTGWATTPVAALYRRLKADGYEPCPDEQSLLKAAGR